MKYLINSAESYAEFQEYLKEMGWDSIVQITYDECNHPVYPDGNTYVLAYSDYADKPKSNPSSMSQLKYDPVIFGKDQTEKGLK